MPRIIVDVPDVELTVEALRSDADRRQRAGLRASAELVASGQKDIRTDAAKVVRILGEATLLGDTAQAIEDAAAVLPPDELHDVIVGAIDDALTDDDRERHPALSDKLVASVMSLLGELGLDAQAPPKPARRRTRKATTPTQEAPMPADPETTGPRNPEQEAALAAMRALDAMEPGGPEDDEDDETGALPEDEPAGAVPDVLAVADPPAAG